MHITYCVTRSQDEEFLKLILRLDPRGKREGELRQVLQECFDVAELERSTKERSNRCVAVCAVGDRALD